MFRQGMDIEEIARKRELVTGTIAGHLEHYVRSGAVKVDQLVSREKVDKITRYLQENADARGITFIKSALGDEVCGYSIGDGCFAVGQDMICRITTKK